jgi:hypothetical protein
MEEESRSQSMMLSQNTLFKEREKAVGKERRDSKEMEEEERAREEKTLGQETFKNEHSRPREV